MSSFDTKQTAKVTLDEIVDQWLEAVLSMRGWTIRDIHRYAIGPDTVPNNGAFTEHDIAITGRLLSTVSASELCYRMSPKEASKHIPEVREVLLGGNVRLVASEARKRADGGFLTFADLFQIGFIGLMTALEKFDPFRGFQFSTYATYWIRQAISRGQANLDRTIRVPVHVIEELKSLLQSWRGLESELNRTPTNVELAKERGLGLDRVEFLFQLARHQESLDMLLQDCPDAVEEGSRVPEAVGAGELISLSDQIARRDVVKKILRSLSYREARVIKLRFGIGGEDAQTLEQIGQKFGVTRERIRQIEAKALGKLRKLKDSYRLQDLL